MVRQTLSDSAPLLLGMLLRSVTVGSYSNIDDNDSGA